MFPLNSIAILINDTTRLWEAVRLLAKSWTCSWHLNGSAFSLSLLLGEICHYHQVKSSRIEFNWQTTLGVCRDPTTMEKKKKKLYTDVKNENLSILWGEKATGIWFVCFPFISSVMFLLTVCALKSSQPVKVQPLSTIGLSRQNLPDPLTKMMHLGLGPYQSFLITAANLCAFISQSLS
jgi:hypothetical protein